VTLLPPNEVSAKKKSVIKLYLIVRQHVIDII